jgi:hypothetical protein
MRFFYWSFSSVVAIVVFSCSTIPSIQTGIPISPIHQVHPQRVLILNAFDVVEQNYRDNKEEFFMSLLDKTILNLSTDVEKRIGVAVITRTGLTPTGHELATRDSVIMSLMDDQKATDAIVITSFQVYFDQTEVEVTRDETGNKSREAHYDIVSNIRYVWYDQMGFFKEETIEVKRFHSTRSVLSGVLAAGPNVVKQSSSVFEIVKENTNRYLNLFLPGSETRIRPYFAGKEFIQFEQAMEQHNYELAYEKAMLLTQHPDRKTAARANYNLAVVSERLNRHYEVKSFLMESNRLYPHQFTSTMLRDY